MEKYNMFVKNKAKIKREERIKAKNQEIYVRSPHQNSDSLKNEAEQNVTKVGNPEKNKKNFKQNLEDLEVIAKKIDRLKSKLEQSLT